MPKIDLSDDELAAVAAALRRIVEEDRFPHAPRLDPLKAGLGKLNAVQTPTPEPPKPAPRGGKPTGR